MSLNSSHSSHAFILSLLIPSIQTSNQRVLVEIFMKFDVDKDGVLNTVELQKFASVTNGGEEFTADDLESIKETFHTRERDSALTMRGFLEVCLISSYEFWLN